MGRFSFPTRIKNWSDVKKSLVCTSPRAQRRDMHTPRVDVGIFVEYSISKYLLNRFKSTGWKRIEERDEKSPRWVMAFGLNSAMVYVSGESHTHGIKSMSFDHFFQHKKQLAQLWEQKWCSMKEHRISRAEIHRKVFRMVTPMSDLEAKLMLRQMGERV